MNYQETLEYLFNQLPMYQQVGKIAYKANLDSTLVLDAYFGHPHCTFKTIHVAGTNGKGSVSHMLASVLQECGLKVGLYTSPHLKDFRERVRVNGVEIGESDVVRFVSEHKTILETTQASFFEMTVALAFDYFRSQNVDVAVVEVGMGGRLDSTNIITPELAVITNIGLDHTAFLGTTLSEIAKEKAGIIKHKIPVVVGQTQQETEAVFRDVAAVNQSDLRFGDQEYTLSSAMISVDEKQVFQIYNKKGVLRFKDLKIGLLGDYQQKNILTVLSAVDVLKDLGFDINDSALANGLAKVVENTCLQGRWQYLGYNPRVICDTGHNEDGIRFIVNQIKNTPHKDLHFVLGMVNDKDHEAVFSLLPKDAVYYFTQASIPRSLNCVELQKRALKHGLNGGSYESPLQALAEAKKNAEVNDLIFIGGSTFLVADLL